MSDEYPGHGAFDGGFEILGEPPASSEPGEGSFNHPSAGQQREALGGVGTLDDLEGPLTAGGHGVLQLFPAIAAIGEHMAQPRIE